MKEYRLPLILIVVVGAPMFYLFVTNKLRPALAAEQAKSALQASPQQSTTAPISSPAVAPRDESSKNYSPYADRVYPARVYWGDQHLHTSLFA